MVKINAASAALLALPLAVSAAPHKAQQWTHPIGYMADHEFSRVSAFFADNAAPKHIKVDATNLGSLNKTMGSGHAAGDLVGPAKNSKRQLADDREQYSDTAYPWGSIGKITWSTGVFCSGSLVGPRHVATARHCAPQGDENADTTVRFMPGYDNGEVLGGAGVTNIYTIEQPEGDCGMKADWAIFVLDTPLGDDLGWLATSSPVTTFDAANMANLGYPGDLDSGERPYRQLGKSVLGADSQWCDEYGPLITDVYAAGGQSGSPIWTTTDDGQQTSFGAMSSTTGTWTSFGTGLEFVNTVNQAREEFP